MTPERARELIPPRLQFGGGYNRNAARLILAGVQHHSGQEAVDGLIVEPGLDEAFGLEPGTRFSGATP